MTHLLEVNSHRDSFIQFKTKVVNTDGDNLDNVKPYQQREKWKINSATTNHYYLTLFRT
jgi:hypothetical protein